MKIAAAKTCRKVAVSRRKTREIPQKRKQYSGRKLSGFFSVDSWQLPVLSSKNRSEIIGKKSEKIPARILLPKFAGNQLDPAVSRRRSLTWVKEKYSYIRLFVYHINDQTNFLNKYMQIFELNLDLS